MGNIESAFLRVCGSALKRNKPTGNSKDEENSNNFLARNKDNYFQKDDYNRIIERFPEYRDWMEQSITPFSHKEKQKKIRWKQGEIIGHGSFGKVMMGLNLETGCMMAVKQVQIGMVNTAAQQDRVKALEIEIELLSQFTHKNIVSYYGSERNKDHFNIFLEYISGGTIASLLDKYGPFNENLIRVYTRQILQGLEYLHVRNTMHRDIKGANVLVDNSGVCKLTDFGTAKRISALVEGESKYLPSIRGTVNWMAPEVIKQTTVGRFCDIWSVGCTVIEMATGKAPWSQLLNKDANCVSLLYQIAQAKSPPPIPKELSNEAVDFLKQCFKINPSDRPNVMKLLNHKFISGVENFSKQLDLPHEKTRCKSQSPMLPHTHRNKKSNSKNNSISIVQPIMVEDSYLDTAPKILITNISPLREEDLRPIQKPHKETVSSVYTFEGLFPDKSKNTGDLGGIKKKEEAQAVVEKKSEGSLQNLVGPQSKDSEEEMKYAQVPTVKTFTNTDISSLNAIRSLTDEANTVKSLQDEVIMGKQRPDMKNKLPRQRPLGNNNKRIIQFKTGTYYANLSEDDFSLTQASFLLAGSPGAANENEEQHLNPGSSRGGSHSNLLFPPTPNGGLGGGMFRNWPESVSQLEEQDEKKDWEFGENGKIEEEEEKEESERGEDRERREERKSNNTGGNRRSLQSRHENNDDMSRVSARSNPEMFTFDVSNDNFEENTSKKGRKSKESSALFKHDYVKRDSLKRNSLKIANKDDDLNHSKTSIEDALQLNHIQPDLAETRTNHFEGLAMSESAFFGKGNNSPAVPHKNVARQNSGINKNKYEMKENNEALEYHHHDKKKRNSKKKHHGDTKGKASKFPFV